MIYQTPVPTLFCFLEVMIFQMYTIHIYFNKYIKRQTKPSNFAFRLKLVVPNCKFAVYINDYPNAGGWKRKYKIKYYLRVSYSSKFFFYKPLPFFVLFKVSLRLCASV